MKILPINNFSGIYTKNIIRTKSEQNNYNCTDLNILNRNYNQVNFRAISKESLEFVQKIPLEDRLASIFEKFLQGDLILVGKNLNKAKERMLNCAGNIDSPIKRVFFIPDEKLHGYLGFTKNREGLNEVINLNNEDIFLIDQQKHKTEPLTPNDSYFVLEGDILGIQGNLLEIKSKPKVDLTGYRKSFCLAKSFEKDINYEIEKLNKKTISQLSKDVKQTSSKVMFKDVGGQDELIDELKKSVIYPLKYPEVYSNFDVNRGFILYGPPGTGKTHIARALANEADVNFVSLNGSEMESKWVGESEENWRNLFEDAKQKQPTILFIDEIDAIAKERSGKDVYGDKVVNQILTLMTDLDNNKENVFVIGATNNFKALDKAFIRSGRFSKHLEVKMPNLEGTKQILDIHTSNKPLDRNLDKGALSKRLFDLKVSGADIKYIVNEAHSLGFERLGIYEKMENKTFTSKDLNKFWITQEDFDKAIQKFVETRNGTERKSIGFNK